MLSNLLTIPPGVTTPDPDPYSPAPVPSILGNPPSQVTVTIIGSGSADNKTTQFTVHTDAGYTTSLKLSNNDTLIQVNFASSADAPATDESFTVNQNKDTQSKDWTLGFKCVEASKRVGTWVFTKGRGDDTILED